MGGGDGIEKVDDGCVPHGMVAVNIKELAAGAVEAVEGRLKNIGIDGGAARTQERFRCADVGGRGGGGSKMVYSRGRRRPHQVR